MLRDDGSRHPDEETEGRTGPSAPSSGASRNRSVLELVGQLEQLAAELASHDPAALDGHSGAEASVRAHRAIDRIRAVQLGWLARVEADGAWLGAGARSVVAWAARAHDVAFAEARTWIHTARTWRDVLPVTAEAARSGLISTLKGALIAKTATTPARIDALTALAADSPDDDSPSARRTGEGSLITLASGYDAAAFTKIARRFAHVADPEADERGYREALAREHFDLAATKGGYHLSGFLTFDHGQAVKTALRSVMGVPAAGDTRTAGQQRAAALTSMSHLLLDHGLASNVGTVRPHLSVHVSQTELDHVMHAGSACGPLPRDPASTPSGLADSRESAGPRGEPAKPGHGSPRAVPKPPALEALLISPPAEWEDGTSPIPGPVLRRLATDCQVTRVIFGAESQVLDVGRTQRTFSGHLRRAVVARDRCCVIDGCSAPPSIGQIHHAQTRWADGGATAVDNAALVCAFHNQWLEDHQVPVRRVVDSHGVARWQIGRPGSYQPHGGGHFPRDEPDH